MHKIIYTEKAPEPGNYSQARVFDCGNYLAVYISGQTGKSESNKNYDITSETKFALESIRNILKEAGGEISDIVKVTVFMKNIVEDKIEFEKAYKEFFHEVLPARSLVEVSNIPLFEEKNNIMIDVIAFVSK